MTTWVFSSSTYLHVVGLRVNRIASDDVSGSYVGVHVPLDPRPGSISPLDVTCLQKHRVLLRYCEGPKKKSFMNILVFPNLTYVLPWVVTAYNW